MQAIVFAILKVIVSEAIIKKLVAEALEAIVESTDNTIDDKMVKPILDVLRK